MSAELEGRIAALEIVAGLGLRAFLLEKHGGDWPKHKDELLSVLNGYIDQNIYDKSDPAVRAAMKRHLGALFEEPYLLHGED